MATKKVIAYCMHEGEFAAVKQHMKNPTWTASYSLGAMEEAAIAQLEAQGLIVEVLEEEAPPTRADMAAGPAAPGTSVRGGMRGGTRGGLELSEAAAGRAPLAGPPQAPVLHPTKDNVFLIKLSGPFLLEEWRSDLSGRGVKLIERLPNGLYTAYLSLAQVGQLKQLPFIDEVRLFAPQDSAGAVFTDVAAGRAAVRGVPGLEAAAAAEILFDVLLHRPEDLDDIEAWLHGKGIPIVASGKRKLRVELPEGSPLAREIEALPEVRQVAEYVEPKLGNEVARRLLGLDPNPDPNPPASGAWPHSGDGEVVAVADSGLDDQHPDFAGRVVGLVPRGRPGDASDPHGHGTHVAGSAVGDGKASGGAHRGTAPKAGLFFQSIMDKNHGLGGLPVELGELFDEAYQAGARVHNNSWSANTKSFYTFNALEVDEYVEAHPDLLVVIAAGNEGSAQDPFNAAPGFVDWLSIGSPATAKNALTVGASRNQRDSGGLADRRWKDFDPFRFADPPIAVARISGDPESLAAFSARGPSDPRRIKPDLVAPGTDILSTRASTAPDGNFWGVLATDKRYAFMGGTSMATPLVSGCAALVREFYVKERGHQPSAALVKATLINSTRRLTGPDAIADHAELPNYHQGFGAVHMPFAYPNPRQGWMQLHFVDTWKPQTPFQNTGDRRRFAFQVNGGAFLRLCLVWTDPAAGADLQNTLGLILEHGGLAPPKVMGNQDRPSPVGRLDRDNNVQIVRIEDPPAGNYMVQVFAANLLHPPQDWALVVTGDLGGPLVET